MFPFCPSPSASPSPFYPLIPSSHTSLHDFSTAITQILDRARHNTTIFSVEGEGVIYRISAATTYDLTPATNGAGVDGGSGIPFATIIITQMLTFLFVGLLWLAVTIISEQGRLQGEKVGIKKGEEVGIWKGEEFERARRDKEELEARMKVDRETRMKVDRETRMKGEAEEKKARREAEESRVWRDVVREIGDHRAPVRGEIKGVEGWCDLNKSCMDGK